MSDIILPPTLPIADCSVRYIDNTGLSLPAFGGPVRTAALGGDRLAMSCTYAPVGGEDSIWQSRRRQLIGFMARMRGKQRPFYAWDRSHVLAGGFPTGELVSNGEFLSGTLGWSSGSGDVTLSSVDGTLRLVRTAATASDVAVTSGAITVVSGACYVVRVCVIGGYQGAQYKVLMGTSVGGSQIATSALISSDAVTTLTGFASGTTMYVSVLDWNSTGTAKVAGAFQEVHYVSVSRCLLANGAAIANAGILAVDQAPASSDLLLTGDQFEVITSAGSELKLLEQSFQPVGTAGHLLFGPPLRGAVADNAAVIIHRPMGRWLYNGQFPEWMSEPGPGSNIVRATVEFEEAA